MLVSGAHLEVKERDGWRKVSRNAPATQPTVRVVLAVLPSTPGTQPRVCWAGCATRYGSIVDVMIKVQSIERTAHPVHRGTTGYRQTDTLVV